MTMSLRHSAVPAAGRAEAGRGAMAYDDVCGGLPYRVFYGSGTDRSCCLRYSFGRCGKEE